jgi:hypothetical protein
VLVRSQKWGKGPFSAARICAQAAGPVLFAGWDANGEPVGMPWATPHIQVAAIAEDQTDNIWRALKPMIELGPLASVIPDTGLERINLPGGGLIEPVTSKALTRLGARITYVELDEPHLMTRRNGGDKLADTMRRNVAGMGGRWSRPATRTTRRRTRSSRSTSSRSCRTSSSTSPSRRPAPGRTSASGARS